MKNICALLLLAFVATILSAEAFGDQHRDVQVGSTTRHFDVHVPKSYRANPTPLVVVLHGGLGCAASAKIDSGMSRRADKRGFIVAYPQGTPEISRFLRTWNAAGCCGTAGNENIDDIGFIRAVIQQTCNDYNIDRKRIFLTGLSNGGMLAYRAADELSDTIAAAASVEGCLISPLKPCDHPVSIIAFHGIRDHVLPYNGGTGSLLGYKIHCLPVSSAIEFWKQQDGCSATAEQVEESGLLKQNFPGRSGTDVCLYTADGGHSWPVVREFKSRLFGKNEHESTTDIICDFFMAHPKE